MMKNVIIILLLIQFSIAQVTGIVNGVVTVKNTKQPLVAAKIQIIKYGLGTSTDSSGYFYLDKIPIGTCHLEVSMIGYEKRLILNLPISSVRPINLDIDLDISPLMMSEVEVRGTIFPRSSSSTISTLNIDQVELRSDPVGVWDIQRAVQFLPSVNQVADQINSIIIRGGSPGENLFIMDNIEIQNPNHFGVDEFGGGGMSLINPLFIKEIDFTPGAFSARFGDKASSVMNMSIREGSKSNFELDFDISIGGLGLVTEGPISNGKGSFLFGSSWSYLDIIVTNNREYTSIPHYNHHQTKFVYDLNPNLKLIFNGLIALDDIKVEAVEEVESFYGVENIDHKNSLMLGGLTIQKLLGNFGYGTLTFAQSSQRIKQQAYDLGLIQYPWFTRNNTISEFSINNNWVLQTKFGEINTGLTYKSINYGHNEWAAPEFTFLYDTTYWIDERWQLPEGLKKPKEIGIIYYRSPYLSNITKNFSKMAYYFQAKNKVGKRFKLTSGIRLDYFSAINDLVISPRINAELSLDLATTFHLAYGRHYQFPDYQMVLRSLYNLDLKTKYSDQFVLGIEHFFAQDFKTTIEFYYKYYNNVYTYYYWSNDGEQFPLPLEHIFHWINEGSAKNYGLELFLQKKLTKNWHGIISYSWNDAIAKDVRTFNQIPNPDTYKNDGKWYDWDYNVRHSLTLAGGWKKNFKEYNWYENVKNSTVYKIFSPIIPIADELEVSFRLLYSSGRPYTEKLYYPEYYDWKIPDDIIWNDKRYPSYTRLDILYLRRYNLKNMNIVFYIDFLNIFNRDNIFDYLYNSNGTKNTVWHLQTLPLFGITLEL
ncbi:MAG: carboxypeptidase-like regulatory domain-containing protein [Candidatus Marinimicrobia bacterium]|nr:carboxypeptidase-like regulatory domain-containing protein [Candidatus Neomarinimicrobiota bacterium]